MPKLFQKLIELGPAILGSGLLIASVTVVLTAWLGNHYEQQQKIKDVQIQHLKDIESLNSEFYSIVAKLALENSHPVDPELIEKLLTNIRSQNLKLESLQASMSGNENVVHQYQETLLVARDQVRQTTDPGHVHALWPVVGTIGERKEALARVILSV